MKFHLAANEVALPNLSALELTPLCYSVCSSWCYWLLIRCVYPFPFSLDFPKPAQLGIQSWFITDNIVAGLPWGLSAACNWGVHIAIAAHHKGENMPSHQLGGWNTFLFVCLFVCCFCCCCLFFFLSAIHGLPLKRKRRNCKGPNP